MQYVLVHLWFSGNDPGVRIWCHRISGPGYVDEGSESLSDDEQSLSHHGTAGDIVDI